MSLHDCCTCRRSMIAYVTERWVQSIVGCNIYIIRTWHIGLLWKSKTFSFCSHSLLFSSYFPSLCISGGKLSLMFAILQILTYFKNIWAARLSSVANSPTLLKSSPQYRRHSSFFNSAPFVRYSHAICLPFSDLFSTCNVKLRRWKLTILLRKTIFQKLTEIWMKWRGYETFVAGCINFCMQSPWNDQVCEISFIQPTSMLLCAAK